MRKAPTVALSEEVRDRLEKLSRGRSVEVRVAERATIVLLAAEGLENTEIAERLGVRRHTVGKWRTRFIEGGEEAILHDALRSGRKPDAEAVADRRHAQEHAHAGRRGRRQPDVGAKNLKSS